MAIKVDEVKFIKLFSDGLIYFIPTYQRSYAWEAPQVKDFWEDLVSAFENKQTQYLMGTIYLAEITDQQNLKGQVAPQILKKIFGMDDNGQLPNIKCNGRKAETKLIIDGQQRLLTYFLLNNAFQSVGVDDSIYNDFFCNLGNGNQIPRLILGENDCNFFIDFLSASDQSLSALTQSNKRIKTAYAYLRQQVGNYKSSKSEQAFQELYEYSINNLSILEAKLDSLDMAATIFITQTDRGKDLTYLEKLKGTISFYSNKIGNPDDLAHRIDRIFGECFKVIDRLADEGIKKPADAENEFVSLIRHIVDVEYEAAGNAFENIKNDLRSIQNAGDLQARIGNLMDALEKSTKFYSQVVDNLRISTNEGYGSAKWCPYTQIFRLLKPNLSSLSMLVEFHTRNFSFHDHVYDWNRNASHDEAMKNISILHDKHAALLSSVAGITGDDNIKSFLRDKLAGIPQVIGGKLNQQPKISLFNLIEGFELGIWKIKDPWKTFSGNYCEFIKNDTSNNGQMMMNPFNNLIEEYRAAYMLRDLGYDLYPYVLSEYERCIYGKDVSSDVLAKTLTREHIFPQDSGKIAPNLAGYGFKDSADYSRWIGNIGNIMLFKDNIAASNNPIVGKIPLYKKSDLESVRAVADDLNTISSAMINVPNPYFKLYLEIRELELMYFTYCRFI